MQILATTKATINLLRDANNKEKQIVTLKHVMGRRGCKSVKCGYAIKVIFLKLLVVHAEMFYVSLGAIFKHRG
jgi:hypothetical protein